MSLNLAQKQAVVAEVAEVASSALSAVAAEYRGLTVAQMTELRVKARDAGVAIRVVKNTLARRAFEGTEFECMGSALVGPWCLHSRSGIQVRRRVSCAISSSRTTNWYPRSSPSVVNWSTLRRSNGWRVCDP